MTWCCGMIPPRSERARQLDNARFLAKRRMEQTGEDKLLILETGPEQFETVLPDDPKALSGEFKIEEILLK